MIHVDFTKEAVNKTRATIKTLIGDIPSEITSIMVIGFSHTKGGMLVLRGWSTEYKNPCYTLMTVGKAVKLWDENFAQTRIDLKHDWYRHMSRDW